MELWWKYERCGHFYTNYWHVMGHSDYMFDCCKYLYIYDGNLLYFISRGNIHLSLCMSILFICILSSIFPVTKDKKVDFIDVISNSWYNAAWFVCQYHYIFIYILYVHSVRNAQIYIFGSLASFFGKHFKNFIRSSFGTVSTLAWKNKLGRKKFDGNI